MNQILQVASYWKLFFFKSLNSTVKTLATAIVTVLTGADWSEMTRTQHVIACCAITVLVCNNLDSLIDKTFSSLSSSNPKKLFEDSSSSTGITQFFKKKAEEQTVTVENKTTTTEKQ